MRTVSLLIVAICVTLGFSCDGHHVPVSNLRGYFWTIAEPGISHRLYIDKEFRGILPHLAPASTTGVNGTVRKQGLNVPLQPGHHEILVTDNNGTMISKGELNLVFKTGNTDISTSWNNGRCMVEVVHD